MRREFESQPVLMIVNVVGVAAATAFAMRGLRRPGYVRPDAAAQSLTRFWAASSAVRTFALAVPLLGAAAGGRLPVPLLRAAGFVQLGDAGLGVWQRKLDMALAPAAMGAVHLITARRLSR